MATATAAAPPSQAERIFLVLETCAAAGRPLGLAELTELTGLPKSSLHRTCGALAELGALEASDDGFQIGVRLFALGSLNPDLRLLRLAAMPYLHELVAGSGWVANVAVLSRHNALLVDEVFGVQPRIAKLLGATLPLHATALGKALLGGQPPARAEELIAALPLRPHTAHTIVRAADLRREVAKIARDGFAVSREEWRLGTAAVAAPVCVGGEARAALGLIGPAGERGIERVRPVVRAAARDLSAALTAAERSPEQGAHRVGAAA